MDATRLPAQAAPDALGSPFIGLYHLWLASWETALTALTVAGRAGTLSTSDVAAHRALITAEREVITRHLILLG